ncbi:MAG: YqiA/YcfP family alpha/beta fold hydrolase [Bacteroidota bacterium]|nr:YqiA/YcfP family alpha/beta fold hydrolase [Bacteroidota bacterium]
MKALYIHGLDSKPNKEKIKIMEEAGLLTFALHLDYRLQENSYEILLKEAIDNQIDFIVGSSLGGYYGFWLAEEMGLPCLLLNPAMTIDRSLPLAISHVKELKCPLRYVVIGANDDTIDPARNLVFFKKANRSGIKQRVITCEWLPHVIDLESFAIFVDWSLSGIRNQNR